VATVLANGAAPIEGDPAITVDHYASQWLAGLPARLRPKTVKSYKELYRLHIGPALGSIGLAELRRAQVKVLLIEKKNQGLSRNTVRLIQACVSTMCSEAVEDGMISSNPALSLMRWVVGRNDNANPEGRHAAIRPFSEAELEQVLSATKEVSPRYFPFLLTLARTGCRPGEALAVRWPDLNFESREILIKRALSAGEIGPTKTGNIRRVDMSRELASVLRGLRSHREQESLRRAWSVIPEWVFINRYGMLIDENQPRRVFARVLKRAGLAGHTVYDLRHTFATLHLAKGHPITYVSAQLGHSDPSTTLRWYAHWLPSQDKRFADSLDTPDRVADAN
jgi:integrase